MKTTVLIASVVAVTAAGVGGVKVLHAASPLTQKISALAPGAVIRLPEGNVGALTITDRHWARPITIEAGNARIDSIKIERSSGIIIHGGKFGVAADPGTRNVSLSIRFSDHIVIDGSRFSDATIGLTIGLSSDVAVRNVAFDGLRSDGMNIAMSRKIVVEKSSCRNFRPIPPDHPDCIQAFSRPKAAPTADILIQNNVMEGKMQGIFFGNHIRDGIDDGGFDRVVIRNNSVASPYTNGIGLGDCRDCVVVGNRVRTLPGGKTSLLHIKGANVIVCENDATGGRKVDVTVKCPPHVRAMK